MTMRGAARASHETSPGSGPGTSRREFLTTTAAAIGAPLLVSPQAAFGSQANSRLTLGAIGCGGRGKWIADLFQKHGGYEITAAADYFQDRVDELGGKFQVAAERRFTGLQGYRRLLESDVDAVVIESPPYFHPRQASDAVEAGKHVYLAKPVAVDVPGCRTVEESGRKATEKGRCFLVDFQTRTDPLYREAVKRAQYGDIGRIVCGEATYFCGPTFDEQIKWVTEKPNDPEVRLRAWGLDRALSGDVITEQNIHALDVASWVLDAAPLHAVGTGGRRARAVGTCWDQFAVIFTFPKDVVVSFASKQLGHGWDDICCRIYGTEGTLDTHYFGEVSIHGKLPFRGGKMTALYQDGAVANIATFHDSITRSDFSNPTVAASVRSNLTTILGRTAAWRGAAVTWDEIMSANEALEADLSGLRS
jgi:predicted dehydrogenase